MALDNYQTRALDNIRKWLANSYETANGDNRIFVLTGYAGTGKSYLINFIKDNLLTNERVAFATFTGKAALVLREKGLEAETLHALLYYVDEENRNGKKELVFKLRPELKQDVRYVIIDEISMVPKKIITDLLSFNVRIIAVGDGFQLPPVAANSDNGLAKKPDAELLEVHRTALDSPIIRLATAIRNKERIGNAIERGPSGKVDLWVGDPGDLSHSQIDEVIRNANQILVGKHRTRIKVNNLAKSLFGFDMEYPLPQKGEKMVCRRNNWKCPLTNDELKKFNEFYNLFGEDKSNKYDFLSGYPEITGTKDIPNYGMPLINGMIGEALNDVELVENKRLGVAKVQDPITKKWSQKKLFEFNLDFRPDFAKFPFEYYQDLAINYLHYNNQDEDDFANLNDLYEYYGIDGRESFISPAYFFQTGYAITVHSAQGSQFKKVLLVNERLNGDPMEHLRWLYTGVTRTEEKLVLFLTSKGL